MSRALPRSLCWCCCLAAVALVAACGGGGGGGGGTGGGTGGGGGGGGTGGGGGGGTAGDDARRMVLADLSANIILPALEAFAVEAAELEAAIDLHAAASADVALKDAARDAWRAAMSSWQYNEPLQVGPAGLSSGIDATPGGADLRSYIYAFPLLDTCTIEQLAAMNTAVTAGSPIETTGLGAIEFLLFTDEANPCGLATPPAPAQRAAYAASAADRVLAIANDLVSRWRPSGGNFVSEWNTAGAGSMAYSRPQDALNALSVALFYFEKDAKDDKIADPVGLGATGLTPCQPVSCPERLESRLSQHSGENIRQNVQAVLDVFTGVGGGMGVNDLLAGISRDDLATEITAELQAVLSHLPTVTPDFDSAVAAIPSEIECINASANPSPAVLPVCALHGYIKLASDTFRGPIVAGLSLATPSRAAGDND